MRRHSLLLLTALIAASCAAPGSAGYILDGHIRAVHSGDVQHAIEAARQRFYAEHHRPLPHVFRVEVLRADEIYVYCGRHYLAVVAPGGFTVRVRLSGGIWRATEMTEEKAPEEQGVIVT